MNDAASAAPRTASRADAQRDRILCAALKCFIEHGFHAASMANIAEAAQMSAGLIYRYFDNKNAIVLAIVERQLEEKRQLIRQMQSIDDLVDRMVQTFEQLRSTEAQRMSVALFLEMSAEGTRNPQIAEALRASDAATREEFQAQLRRRRVEGGAEMPDDLAAKRALQLRCLFDGLALRAAREPDLDPAFMRDALEDLLRRLFD
jgi:AcrR family transcriptional regulator